MRSLDQALAASSPRLSPPRTPPRAILIHGAVTLLWLLLFARAFVVDNVFAWSAGIAYVAYDTLLLGFVFWKTLPLMRPQPELPLGQRCSIGVIVAAHNEAGVLPATIAALMAQNDAPDEIVIADDGSSDDTETVLLERFGLRPPALGELSDASPALCSLRWLRLPRGGKAQALNLALARSTADVMMTVDADTMLAPGGVAAMRRAFSADPNLVAATGILTPICGPGIGGRLMQWFQTYEYIRNFLSRYAWGRMDSLLLISGAFGGYRRLAVLEVGGFDPACLVEDYELIHRLLRAGEARGLAWRTAVIGAAQASTEAPSSIGAFLRQRRRWFGGFLQTQYWYRDMIGNGRYGWLGTLMLPVKAIDTLQPVYGLLGVALLVYYIATGALGVLAPVAGVIGAKIVLDLGFHLWGVVLYSRWVGEAAAPRLLPALLSSIVEPFTFQILRHAGASWGWVIFLTGENTWGTQRRVAQRFFLKKESKTSIP